MKKKMGRPTVPKSEKRIVLMQFKVRSDEAKTIQAAIAKSRGSRSEWMRNAVLAAANCNEPVS